MGLDEAGTGMTRRADGTLVLKGVTKSGLRSFMNQVDKLHQSIVGPLESERETAHKQDGTLIPQGVKEPEMVRSFESQVCEINQLLTSIGARLHTMNEASAASRKKYEQAALEYRAKYIAMGILAPDTRLVEVGANVTTVDQRHDSGRKRQRAEPAADAEPPGKRQRAACAHRG